MTSFIDNFENIILKRCKSIKKEDTSVVKMGLFNYRGFVDKLLSQPDLVLSILFKNYKLDKLVYPCDLVELRNILNNNKISNGSPICLLSLEFATEILNTYPVYIVLRTNDMIDCFDLNSFKASRYGSIDIKDHILEIIVDQVSNVMEQTQKIVADCNKYIDVKGMNRVPGISQPNEKLASKKYAQQQITLTPKEQQIFNLLLTIKKTLNLPIEIRIVGGFVRDKLLNIDSDDIDFAISHMSGYEFALTIEKYARQNNIKEIGQAFKVSLEKSADPKNQEELSDALMVGGIYIYEQKVEFVPMREEIYEANSRTPKIIRTNDVKLDAMRRDLTINDIYYNIESGQIEDYVNGIQDLKNMFLRTPIDPIKTFTDDPLRVLRALRFYSRYPNATLDPKIIEAMKDQRVQQAYRSKVAPTRAGKELEGMLGGTKPSEAVKVLFETGFYKEAFNVPEMQNLGNIDIDQQTPHHVYNLMEHTLKVLKEYNDIAIKKNLPKDRRILRNLAALFHDFGKMHPEIRKPKINKQTNKSEMFDREGKQFEHMQYIGHEDKSETIADAVMKSIGIGDKERKYVNKLIVTHMRPHVENWSAKSQGKFLKELTIPGQEDKDNELLEDLYDHGIADEMFSDPEKANVDLKKQHYQGFLDFKAKQTKSNPSVPVNKPILNGNELMQMFPTLKSKSGFIPYLNNILLEKRYENPNLTKEEAIQLIENMRGQVMSQFGDNTPIKAFNLKKYKLSQTNDPAGYDQFNQKMNDDWGDTTYVNHGDNSPYRVGQTVMLRKGLGFKQIYGKITQVSPVQITIKWDDGTEKEYGRDEAFLRSKFQFLQ